MNQYYTYIMASHSGVLYTGMTNDLERRVQEHKSGVVPGFSQKYKTTRLVWFETFTDVNEAIEAEKKIKGWVRRKKIALIEAMNPTWRDLAEVNSEA
ncbi:GIY-YIG nuclease family protein [Aeoliella mucimassa]|uniref:GIY-YIG nuclease superfamily protein n=1 Tax=Aeoliella mucimassa TaxID=2527972 RepID=A0A518AHJ0_9BACT|nr:GIY-YIG nuclease family protein [Aeoliella mucimassa]QDU54198.1 GIY-YIG nuclease superfamily protein [Aeoliella mucimassa]